MKIKVLLPAQTGFTLIELLLYVAILGTLLFSVSTYFFTATTARVKNQSIAEVDQQGALAMEYVTQTIRNASSITSPAAGANGSSLTLVVPTGSLSPTVFDLSAGGGTVILGYDQDGGIDGELMGGNATATKFVAGADGTVTTLYARVGEVASAPNDKAQMAIYSGAFNPSTLLASSPTTAMASNSWNGFTISPTAVTSGQTYWLAYNTNVSSQLFNNVRLHAGSSGQSMAQAQSFGSWPASIFGTPQDIEYSMYAEIDTGGGGGAAALQVTEGAASPVPLTNDKVEITNLSFKNLSRPGTPGVVQVSFTISRVNSNNRNEYDYQKTFTATAALRP